MLRNTMFVLAVLMASMMTTSALPVENESPAKRFFYEYADGIAERAETPEKRLLYKFHDGEIAEGSEVEGLKKRLVYVYDGEVSERSVEGLEKRLVYIYDGEVAERSEAEGLEKRLVYIYDGEVAERSEVEGLEKRLVYIYPR